MITWYSVGKYSHRAHSAERAETLFPDSFRDEMGEEDMMTRWFSGFIRFEGKDRLQREL